MVILAGQLQPMAALVGKGSTKLQSWQRWHHKQRSLPKTENREPGCRCLRRSGPRAILEGRSESFLEQTDSPGIGFPGKPTPHPPIVPTSNFVQRGSKL